MRGQITAHTGDLITIKLIDQLDVETVKKQAVNGKYYVNVEVFEKDKITKAQRKHLYALFKDIEEYTGVPLDHVEAERKFSFMNDEALAEFPSLGFNKMKKTTASKFIEHTIDYCITNDIPFRRENWYLEKATSKQLFALTMKRICWICGAKQSQIAHVESVGAGRNRKKIDHTKHHVMCLCHNHHQEQHNMGINHFIDRYHIKPIKLREEHIKQLGL